MARRSIRRSQFVPSGYSYGNEGKAGEYGFLLAVPLLGAYLAKKGVDTVTEPDKPLGVVRDYWWVFLMGLPLAYVGVNFALNKATGQDKIIEAEKAKEKEMWG